MGGLFYRVKSVKVLPLRFICRRMNPYIRKKSCLEEVGMKENNVYIPPMQMTFISVMTKKFGEEDSTDEVNGKTWYYLGRRGQ